MKAFKEEEPKTNDNAGKLNAAFKKNLKDIDTLAAITESQQELHATPIYKLNLEFIQALLLMKEHKVIKRAFRLMSAALQRIHYTYCLDLFQVMKNFYTSSILETSAKGKSAAGGDDVVTQRLNKSTVQKVQPVLLRFFIQFFDSYFLRRIQVAGEKTKVLEEILGEVNECFEQYLPLAVVMIRQRSRKVRQIAKEFLVKLDEVYEKILGDATGFLNMILAGLAGKTPQMKSSTILVIAIIWSRRFRSMEPVYIDELLEVIL